MDRILKFAPAIANICKQHTVEIMYVFGSVLKDDFKVNSDIDLVVRFGDIPLKDYADNYFGLCEALENLLGRKVDVAVESSIRNPFFKEEVDEIKQLLFAA